MSKIQLAVGVNQGQVPVLPPPVIALRDPSASDVNYSPGQLWFNKSSQELFVNEGSGVWNASGQVPATDSTYGTVYLTDNNEPVATQFYVDAQIASVVVGAVPAATETTSGIAELATTAETTTGTDDQRIVTPLKLTQRLASPSAIGGTTPSAGTFTDLTADGSGAVSLGSNAAADFTVATGDLSLIATLSSVVITGNEAATDAIDINAANAAGGIDIDAGTGGITIDTTGTLSLDSAGATNLTATGAFDVTVNSTAGSLILQAGESATDAVVLESTAGGVQILASGAAAGEDILLTATGSSIRLVSTENVSDSIVLSSTNGGIQVLAPGAAPGEDIELTATGSSVKITATENATDAVNIEATTGGINILASGAAAGEDINITATGSSVNLSSTEDAALAIYLHANGGTSETIRLRADQGTGVNSIDLLSDVGGITLTSGLASADAINISCSDAAGGIDVDAGTAGFIVDTTGAISLDSAAASNYTVTGAFDLTLNSTAGSVIVQGAEAAIDAVTINASNVAGGIDVNAGTGGITIDTTGTLSLDSAGATNLTATGAFDLSVISTAGSVIINGGEAAVDAVTISATNAAGGIDINAGTGGITIDSGDAISIDSVAASNYTVTGAADLTLSSSAGAVNITSGEANADSINVTSAGGMNIVATGAAAKDVILTCTSGSMTLTAGENVTDAMNITASGAASRVNISAGTGSINLASGLIVDATAVNNAASPYSVLGTDYFLAVDTSAGSVTVTLPAATAVAGQTYVIRDVGGAAAANNITIGGGGTNLVGGGAAAASKVLSAAYSGATVISDGTVWSYSYTA